VPGYSVVRQNRCVGIKRFPLNENTSVLDGRLIRGPAKELAENVNRALSGYSEIAEKARELTRKENGRTGKPVLWLLAGAA